MRDSTPVVIDASVLLDYLLGERHADAVDAVVRGPSVRLHAPELIDQELLSVVRRLERVCAVDEKRAEELLRDAGDLYVELHPLRPHFDRVWSLRRQITATDAYYVSVAETLGAPLLTTDHRLARAVHRLPGLTVIELGEDVARTGGVEDSAENGKVG